LAKVKASFKQVEALTEDDPRSKLKKQLQVRYQKMVQGLQ
jgi:hypothetical protein